MKIIGEDNVAQEIFIRPPDFYIGEGCCMFLVLMGFWEEILISADRIVRCMYRPSVPQGAAEKEEKKEDKKKSSVHIFLL